MNQVLRFSDTKAKQPTANKPLTDDEKERIKALKDKYGEK